MPQLLNIITVVLKLAETETWLIKLNFPDLRYVKTPISGIYLDFAAAVDKFMKNPYFFLGDPTHVSVHKRASTC